MVDLVPCGDYTDFSDGEIPLGIIVRSYSKIGTVSGMGNLNVEAREVVNVDNRSVSYFLIAAITSGGQYPKEGHSIIKYDEIEKICLAIDRIKFAHPKITKFRSFEVQWASEDGFKICVFNQERGGLGISVSGGNVSMFLNGIQKLGDIRQLFEDGKKYIDENRIINNTL